ncbi:MAG TPA: glycosyltransferase family 9 protein [Gammaproteobacteria bacterium]
MFNVRKIAVVRANALGDYIFAIPALEALKLRYPDAELVYLGKAWHKSFLEGRPGPVDRVEIVPKCHGIPHESDRVENRDEVDSFFEMMQAEHFDLAFQMHGGGGHSNPFTKSLGAAVTVGFQDRDAEPLDINVPYHLYQHEVMRYLELVKKAGAGTDTLEPRIALTESDIEQLFWFFPDLSGPYAVIHPGASDIHRQWSPQRFALVGDSLAEKGLAVYITGTDGEKDVVGNVVSFMKNHVVNLCGKLTLNALTALLANARLVLSNDTGPLYLARALAVPTIGIYWIGNLITASAISVERNRCCISWRVNCPLCGIDCIKEDVHHPSGSCDHLASFVNDVETEEVMRHADDLLSFSKTTEVDTTSGRRMGAARSMFSL